MQVRGKEVDIMQQLGEKAMTDEETDSDDPNLLVKRTLPWRSKKLKVKKMLPVVPIIGVLQLLQLLVNFLNGFSSKYSEYFHDEGP